MALKTAKHNSNANNSLEIVTSFELDDEQRVQTELTAMHEEEQSAKQRYANMLQDAEEKAKKQAMQDLQSFKDDQPSKILEDAKRDATSKETHIANVGHKKSSDIVKKLIQSLSQYV